MALRHNAKSRALLDDPTLAKRWEEFRLAAERWYFGRRPGRTWKSAFSAARRALPTLLTSSAKTVKGEKKGILTGILYLAPADESGFNVCPNASEACRALCLGHTSGRMAMVIGGGLGDHKRARILRTWAFLGYRELFLAILRHEIRLLEQRAARRGMRPFVRLNGTSDLRFDEFIREFPRVQFYDYTKDRARMAVFVGGLMPENYHITFSRDERSAGGAYERAVMAADGNVAVVFKGEFPETWNGARVVDGDKTDGRPDDARGVVVGLSAKGPVAKRDRSGFVVRTEA